MMSSPELVGWCDDHDRVVVPHLDASLAEESDVRPEEGLW